MIDAENGDWRTSEYRVPNNVLLGRFLILLVFGAMASAAFILTEWSVGERISVGAMGFGFGLWGLWLAWNGLGVVKTGSSSIALTRLGRTLEFRWDDLLSLRWDVFGHLLLEARDGSKIKIGQETERFEWLYDDVRRNAYHALRVRELPLTCRGNIGQATILGVIAILGLVLALSTSPTDSGSAILVYGPTLMSLGAAVTLIYAFSTWLRQVGFHESGVLVRGPQFATVYPTDALESIDLVHEAGGLALMLSFKDLPPLRFRWSDVDIAPAEIFEAVRPTYGQWAG